MIRRSIAGAALGALLAWPAAAQDARPTTLSVGNAYFSGSVGAAILDDVEVRPGPGVGTDTGARITAAVGYDYRPYRIELEGSYQLNDVAAGDVEIWSAMANGYYDFHTGTQFTPYLGGGLGVANTEIDTTTVAAGPVDASETGFAWQLMAGVSYTMTPNSDIFGGYRFFQVEGFDAAGLSFEDIDTHNFEIGLRYRF